MYEKFPFFTDIFVVYVRRRGVCRKFSSKNVINTEIIRLTKTEGIDYCKKSLKPFSGSRLMTKRKKYYLTKSR
jgi:hypothetical protein